MVNSRHAGGQRKQQRVVQAIASIATALRFASQPAEIGSIIVDQLADLTDADRVALLLVDPDTHNLVVTAAHGPTVLWNSLWLPLRATLTGYLFRASQSLVSQAPNAAPGRTQPGWADHPGALACVPLTTHEGTVGALCVTHRQPVDDEEWQLLVAIAGMAAHALQRIFVLAELEKHVQARTRKLAEANEYLKELDQLKTRFVSDVTHELRNPVSVLKLYVDLLQRGPPDKHAHYLAILQEQAGRLTRLLDDVLSLSRLDMGAAGTEFMMVEVNSLVTSVVDACQAEAEATRLALTFIPASGLPSVRGDPKQLALVVTNLISNAIKFTPSGSIEVATYAADPDVCLQVKDTGIGIEPRDLSDLFTRFYRGNTAVTLDIPGSGLGLSIVKSIVDLHGGRVEVDSEVGRGTVITVRVPAWHSQEVL